MEPLLKDLEELILCPLATRSRSSKGREYPEEPCPLRTCFQRDRDRILHSKAFRRLKHKTQVFMAPIGDHYRTRLTHTLEVSQIARTIARALRLNEDLTEAIALGHDLGHPPFGHTGEGVLNRLFSEGFHHELQSVRIVTIIEPLNLTREVWDGIAKQMNGGTPETLEASVVKTADRMTYLHHDVEDAIRAGLMHESDLPKDILHVLGSSRGSRLKTMLRDLVKHSQPELAAGNAVLRMSGEVREAMAALRQWMFDKVYLRPARAAEQDKIDRLLTSLYDYFCKHPEALPEQFRNADTPINRRVVDYIAGMTDHYATNLYINQFLPSELVSGRMLP